MPGDSRLEITCIAYGDLAEKKRIGDPPPGLPFSPGILAGDTLYISGKGDQLPGGGHPATFEEQVRQAMKNVETTLKQAGLDFRHVVMSHVFLESHENLEVANKVYNEFFEDGNEPACVHGRSSTGSPAARTSRSPASPRPTWRPARSSGRPAEDRSERRGRGGSPARLGGQYALRLRLLPAASTVGAASAALGDQVHQMAKNHIEVLDAAGLKLEDIVGGFVYLSDMKDYDPMNDVYREYYSRGPGVRTCLMPGSGIDKSSVLVRGSFIAARTH